MTLDSFPNAIYLSNDVIYLFILYTHVKSDIMLEIISWNMMSNYMLIMLANLV